MTPRRELKKYAKEAMSGKYGTIILGFVAVQALAVISSMVSSSLFPGTEKLDIVLGYAFSFILTLLVNVVAAGLNYMYLNIARGKAYSLNDLIYFYKHHPDRVIVATFFLAVLNVLTMLPYTIYGNTAEIGNSDHLAVQKPDPDACGNDRFSDSVHSAGNDVLYTGRSAGYQRNRGSERKHRDDAWKLGKIPDAEDQLPSSDVSFCLYVLYCAVVDSAVSDYDGNHVLP